MNLKKVVVVEDDPVLTRLYQLQLRRAGCEGVYFRDGESALRALEKQEADLFVLDYNLPDMEGPEILAEIRKIPSLAKVPVIFITGQSRKSILDELGASDIAAVFTKPFSPALLLQKIKELFR